MIKKTQLPIALAAMAAIMLSGCNKDSSSRTVSASFKATPVASETSENSFMAISFSAQSSIDLKPEKDISLEVIEGDQASIAGHEIVDNRDGSFSLDDDDQEKIDFKIPSGEFIWIETGDVDKNEDLTLRISGFFEKNDEDDPDLIKDSFQTNVYFTILNESHKEILTQIDHTTQQKHNILNLSEDRGIHRFFVDYLYSIGIVGFNEKKSLLSGFSPASTTTYLQVNQAIESLEMSVMEYKEGSIDEPQLRSDLDAAQSVIKSHGEYGRQKLIEIKNYSINLMPDITSTDLIYDPVSGLYSRVVSYELYGQYPEESAVYDFDGDFELIGQLIRETRNEPSICEAI